MILFNKFAPCLGLITGFFTAKFAFQFIIQQKRKREMIDVLEMCQNDQKTHSPVLLTFLRWKSNVMTNLKLFGCMVDSVADWDSETLCKYLRLKSLPYSKRRKEVLFNR